MSDTPANPASRLFALFALPEDQQLATLAAEGPLADTVLAVVEEAAELASREATRAVALTERASALADHADVPLARARARRAQVRALAYAGRLEEALAVSIDAVRIAERAGHLVEAGRSRLASMHALSDLGRLPEAVEAGQTAREIFVSVEEPALAARADINLGIAFQRQDRPDAAIGCFDRARPQLLSEPLMLGHLENSRGEALLATNDFAGAGAAFGTALEAFEDAGATLPAAIAQSNLADLAARGGSLPQALFHFEGARRNLERADSPAHLARMFAEQAEAKAVLGLPQEALREYEQAIVELDRCGTALEAARARCGAGFVLARLDRAAEAETALAAAATAFDELGHATARARVDLARAELALRRGRLREGRRIATRALANLDERPADAATAHHLLARLALADGDADTASAELEAAIVGARRLGLAPLLAEILTTRGGLRLGDSRLDEAIADLSEAVAHIERIRGSLQADRLRAAFLGDRLRAHEQLVGALLDRGETNAVADAFAVAERAKSRSLLDQVLAVPEAPSDHGNGNTPDARLDDAFHDLRSELNALYSRIADEGHGGADATKWREAVRTREEALDDLSARMAAGRGARWLFTPSCALGAVHAALEADERLVEYFIAEDRVLAFVVGPDAAVVRRDLATTEEILTHLHRVRFQMNRALRPGATEGPGGARRLRDVREALARLEALLVGPLRDQLGDARRLVIVPHGPMHLVPFHALWDGERHLIENYEIVHAPSASLWIHLRGSDATSTRHAPLVVGVADALAPAIAEEAIRVAEVLHASNEQLLVGEDATADRVLELAPHASLLHFAGHARFLADAPTGSGLMLADRWLTVRDICGMNLNADLITLSGCETGVNAIRAGDELTGLLRSLFTAGARSVILSLWPVADEETRVFMSRLYADPALAGERPVAPAAALRRAQLAMLAERPHPAHWAPFIVEGLP